MNARIATAYAGVRIKNASIAYGCARFAVIIFGLAFRGFCRFCSYARVLHAFMTGRLTSLRIRMMIASNALAHAHVAMACVRIQVCSACVAANDAYVIVCRGWDRVFFIGVMVYGAGAMVYRISSAPVTFYSRLRSSIRRLFKISS